jgi:hypothetical protein
MAEPRAGTRGTVVTVARTVLLCLALLGCGARRAKAPDWVLSAPGDTETAISCAPAWAMAPAHFQALLQGFPPAGRALAVFLERTRIDLRQETGRVTFYLSRPAPGARSEVLVQLGGFRDPGRLQVAVADAFPAAGTLVVDHRELPLFVLLDQGPSHFRAVADGAGRIWLGDLPALARLGPGHVLPWSGLAVASSWISGAAAVQGFVLPREPAAQAAWRLPRGIQALAWSVTPGPGAASFHGFELALAGSRPAIQGAVPWLEDFVAAAQATPGPQAQLPDLLQERRRLGLRWRLTQAQLNVALGRLDLPAIPCP